jgi:hypothetical protein
MAVMRPVLTPSVGGGVWVLHRVDAHAITNQSGNTLFPTFHLPSVYFVYSSFVLFGLLGSMRLTTSCIERHEGTLVVSIGRVPSFLL